MIKINTFTLLSLVIIGLAGNFSVLAGRNQIRDHLGFSRPGNYWKDKKIDKPMVTIQKKATEILLEKKLEYPEIMDAILESNEENIVIDTQSNKPRDHTKHRDNLGFSHPGKALAQQPNNRKKIRKNLLQKQCQEKNKFNENQNDIQIAIVVLSEEFDKDKIDSYYS